MTKIEQMRRATALGAVLRGMAVGAVLAWSAAVGLCQARENPRLAAVDYQVQTYGDEATRARLAGFDLAILSFWRGYGAPRVTRVVDDLHHRHPGMLLGQYTALNEVQAQAKRDDANRDLVEKLDQQGWWLHDAQGERVRWTSTYGNDEVNLTSGATPDDHGLRWPQWKAERDVHQVFNQWPSLNFVFVDNVFEQPRVRAVWRAGGREEGKDSAEFAREMRRGYLSYFDRLRSLLPGVPLIGNVDSDLSSPEYHHALDGAFLENLIGRRWSIESQQGWGAMMHRYRAVSQQVRRPELVIFHMTAGANDYRLMRYGLASCLMGDGYFAFSADGSTSVPWFDEYDVDLGAAQGPAEPVVDGAATWRRFARGMAVVNPGPNPVVVHLPPGYAHIKGSQDPTVNNGEPVSELRLPPRDGVILVKTTR
jgi:hypothetical protein